MQKNVLEYLEATAARLPEATAYWDESESVSFSALLDRARAVGTALHRLAGQPGRPVAVLARRSCRTLIGCFGALYAGCCYAPLDAAMPLPRLRSILARLRPAALVFEPNEAALAEQLADLAPLLPPDAAEEIDLPALEALRRAQLDLDPVYLIYTSGSTGTPKGIAVSHRSVIDFTDWYADFTGVTEADRIANQAPFFFDLSVKDVYLTLKTGATTYILPKKCYAFPVLLLRALNEHRITTLSWATAAFHMTANSGVFEKYRAEHLRRVLLGGEALQARQLNLWRRAMPDVNYVNLYGPTETTVDCTYYPITRDFADGEPIPIGFACPNKEVFLLREDGTVAETDESGELCVRGSGVAIGYYGEPERTAAAFTPDPRQNTLPGRIYRTGDLAVRKADGLLYFLGRKDSQIKHNGYRIELGEIETAMAGLPGVDAAVCLFDAERDRLVGLYAGTLEPTALSIQLRARLPKYLVPEELRQLPALPRLPNGKLDRVRLRQEQLA